MDFLRIKNNDVVLVQVNLVRASLKEVDQFRDILMKDIQSGEKKFVVDLSKCEFVDSTFLGTLVISLKRLTAFGGDIKLVGFQPAVSSMLELTRMNKVFESFTSSEVAIKSFN